MASVLLAPSASFLIALFVGLALLVLALTSHLNPGPLLLETIEFFLVALVGWLASRSLENTLTELRKINQELDRRVAERTHDLADALVKVQSESGKNQAILESIADGVIVFDQVGRATVANPAIGNLLELPSSHIVGHNIQTLMVGAVSDADRGQLIEVLSDRTHGHSNIRLQWANKTLSASVAPIHIREDADSSTVIVFRDITREAELDRMKSLFVSMVSHELRTPLNAILGYGEMLHESVGGSLSEKQMSIVDRLIANTKRLLGLVNDLLDRAQLEAGKLSLRMVAFSPAALLNDMLSVVAHMAKAKDLELITQIEAEVPDSLIGDPQRLLQVLINLVSNAIKFTAEGQISVLIRRRDATHWLMEVSDTGSGIPLDEQPRVFEWFRQVDRSTTGRQAGAGLGLSIVRDLVTLMNGEIHLASQIGQGSTFTVILPLTNAQEKTP
jgi:PAS domain S-box-containing protein